MLAWGFFSYIKLGKFPSIKKESLIKMSFGFYQMLFCIYDKIMWFFYFNLILWWITLIDFKILSQPCTPRISCTWLWFINLFIYYWIWFANILVRMFVSTLTIDMGLQFPFLTMSLVCVLKLMLTIIKWDKEYFFSNVSGEVCVEMVLLIP